VETAAVTSEAVEDVAAVTAVTVAEDTCITAGCNRRPWNGQPDQPCCQNCASNAGSGHNLECEQRFNDGMKWSRDFNDVDEQAKGDAQSDEEEVSIEEKLPQVAQTIVGVWHDGEQEFEIEAHDDQLIFKLVDPSGGVLQAVLEPCAGLDNWMLANVTSADGEVQGTLRLQHRGGAIASQAQDPDSLAWGEEITAVCTATKEALIEWEKRSGRSRTVVGEFEVRVHGMCWGEATTFAFNENPADSAVSGRGFAATGPFVITGKKESDGMFALVISSRTANLPMRVAWNGDDLKGRAEGNKDEISLSTVTAEVHAQFFKEFKLKEKDRGFTHCASCFMQWACSMPWGSECDNCHGPVAFGRLRLA